MRSTSTRRQLTHYQPKHQLAQYAATGCLNRTFYVSAEGQLAKVLELCEQVDAEFIAKLAVFSRERGYMKDMPALLCAVLSVKDRNLLNAIFPRAIDNARMLRNFVQIMRSGVVGRKSLGTAPKRMVREWLDARDPCFVVQGERWSRSFSGGHREDGPPEA
jgi:60 kDa SS-A/Ro ribonucleoprotein